VLACPVLLPQALLATSLYYGGESEDFIGGILFTALPMLYGSVLHRVKVLVSDGGPALVSCIDRAVGSSWYPAAIARRCFWHAVTKTWHVQYSVARASVDGGTGYEALDWVRHISWHAESPEVAEGSLCELEAWIAGRSCIGDDARTALHSWLNGEWRCGASCFYFLILMLPPSN
jgi:hypothetical protein